MTVRCDLPHYLANCEGLASSPSFEIHTLARAILDIHARVTECLRDGDGYPPSGCECEPLSDEIAGMDVRIRDCLAELAEHRQTAVEATARADALEARVDRLERELAQVRRLLGRLDSDVRLLGSGGAARQHPRVSTCP